MQLRDLIPWGRHEQDHRAQQGALATSGLRRDEETHPFLTLHREVNRLFDDVFRDFGCSLFGRTANWPSVEVSEDSKAIRVSAELPGMDENDVDVAFEDGVLVLRGEKRADVEDKDRHYSEHYYGRFERVVPVPVAIDEDAIKATFKKGVLTVTLPKSKAQQEGVRRIPISKG